MKVSSLAFLVLGSNLVLANLDVILFNRQNREVKTLVSATSYIVTLNNKIIISKKNFLKSLNTPKKKENFLLKLLFQLESNLFFEKIARAEEPEEFRVILYDKSNRQTEALSKAKSFSVKLGSTFVIKKQKLSPRLRTNKAKELFLTRLLFAIESSWFISQQEPEEVIKSALTKDSEGLSKLYNNLLNDKILISKSKIVRLVFKGKVVEPRRAEIKTENNSYSGYVDQRLFIRSKFFDYNTVETIVITINLKEILVILNDKKEDIEFLHKLISIFLHNYIDNAINKKQRVIGIGTRVLLKNSVEDKKDDAGTSFSAFLDDDNYGKKKLLDWVLQQYKEGLSEFRDDLNLNKYLLNSMEFKFGRGVSGAPKRDETGDILYPGISGFQFTIYLNKRDKNLDPRELTIKEFINYFDRKVVE